MAQKSTQETIDSVTEQERKISNQVESVQVAIENLSGRLLQFEGFAGAEIRDVKSKIAKEWEIPEEDQVLIDGTQVAQNSETLASLAMNGSLRLTMIIDQCISGPLQENVNSNDVYHIKTSIASGDFCLDACLSQDALDNSVGLAAERPCVGKMGPELGMQWRIEPMGSFLRIGPKALVDSESCVLDLLNPSKQPCFRSWGSYSGQYWKFEEVQGGYRLSTKWTPELFLTYEHGKEYPSMQRWEHCGVQVWIVKRYHSTE